MTTSLKSTSPERHFLGCERPSGKQLLWAMAFSASMLVGLLFLRHLPMPLLVRYLIPAIPVLAGARYMQVLVSDMRRQHDELQLRIYLEAAAVVVCGLFILMVCYPLLEEAHLVGPLDSYYVVAAIAALGVIGFISGARRYR